jgi:hypothetical protein
MSDDNKNLMVVFSTKYHTPYTSSRIWTWSDDTVGFGRGLSPLSNYYYYSNANLFTFSSGCGCSTTQNYDGTSYLSMSGMLTVVAGFNYPD